MADETTSRGASKSSTVFATPTTARVWDALLGGKDNWAGDRALVERALAIDSEVAGLAHAIHDFRTRAVRHLASDLRIDQFIECGPGLPTSDNNTTNAAQKFNPLARVVYVDRDPTVASHARALLATNQLVRVVEADPLDVGAVRKHPDLEGFIDWGRPVAVINTVLLPFATGQEPGPGDFLTGFVPELVSGSHLVLAFFATAPDERLVRVAGELAELFTTSSLGGGQFLPVPEIAAMLDGLDLVRPGLVPCDLWRDDRDYEPDADSIRQCAVGAVACVP